jgi:hypothetical protein
VATQYPDEIPDATGRASQGALIMARMPVTVQGHCLDQGIHAALRQKEAVEPASG